jgi:hypothetical protein
MVQFNTRANEILLKLVYYGPGLSGKTTNLQLMHAMCSESNKGEMFSVNTQEDRTLFFDLLPINLGYVYGNAIHLQIYTVPGQVQYDASRRVVLGGADGVVFVADSSEAKMQDNVDSLSNLYHNLNANRLNIKQIPFVLQYNKRDLPDAMAVGVMNRRLNFRNVPYFEAVANKGVGVLDTFLAITRETVATTFRKYHLDKKIKDFDEMLNLIESNLRTSMLEPSMLQEAAGRQESTVLRHSNVSVEDLQAGKVADASELLEDALKANMETARLYSELKAAKDALDHKGAEMAQLNAQLERANADNLKTRRYLESLIQSVGEAIVSFGPDGKILTWNNAAERMFGYSRAEVAGQGMGLIVPHARAGETEQAMAIVGQGQSLRDVQTTRLRKDGREFPAAVTYAPVKGADDRILAYSAVIRDLDDQKALERRLHDSEAQGSLGRVLEPVFNDLVGRLAPLQIQARAIQESSVDSAHGSQLNRLVQGLDNLSARMRPLMMILTPAAPRREPASLNALAQEAVKKVEMEAAAAAVNVETALDPNVGQTAFDADQVREALAGLLRNAIQNAAKATQRRIRLATRAAPSAYHVVVQDTGPLVPAAEQPKYFDLASVDGPEGLGRVLAATILRQHGGRIALRSQEGAGNAVLGEIPFG